MSYGEDQMTGLGFMRIIPVSCCLGEDGGLWWRYEEDESLDDRVKYLYSE